MEKELKKVRFNESEYNLEKGKGKIAVFMYTGIFNPQIILDETIKIYTNGNLYHEFIDANHNNPWTRVIMSDINNMKQKKFNKDDDRL